MAWGVAVEPSRPCTQRGGAGRVSLCGLPLGPGPPQVPLLPTLAFQVAALITPGCGYFHV